MSSNAGILIHGKINDTHTTHMNAQYAPNNIPTPWPFVLFSLLLSFIICCVGAVPDLRSLDPDYAPPIPTTTIKTPVKSKPANTTASSSTSPPAYSQTGIELQPVPPYAKNGILVVPDQKAPLIPPPPKVPWKFPTSKFIYYLTAAFCTFRAVSAFMIGIKSLQDDTTPLAAPSVILLALISTQIIHCNINHSPLTRFVLELDIIALAVSFGIAGYAPNGGEWWPRYSTMKIADDNCAVYAGDCMSQAPHWLSVGCGTWTTPTNYDSGVDYGFPYQFYLPYQNTGDLNVKTGMNPLHATEMTIIIFGTLWWVFVLLHLLDIFSTIEDLFKGRQTVSTYGPGMMGQRSIFESVKSLISPLVPRFRWMPTPRARKEANDYQKSFYKFIIGLGIFLAFVVMIMSIGAHTSQMIKKQQTTYLESFGPQVGTNFTLSPQGVITASDYWGNETSWSDCFIVRAPGSRNGFWSEWVESNRKGNALFRIAAGL